MGSRGPHRPRQAPSRRCHQYVSIRSLGAEHLADPASSTTVVEPKEEAPSSLVGQPVSEARGAQEIPAPQQQAAPAAAPQEEASAPAAAPAAEGADW